MKIWTKFFFHSSFVISQNIYANKLYRVLFYCYFKVNVLFVWKFQSSFFRPECSVFYLSEVSLEIFYFFPSFRVRFSRFPSFIFLLLRCIQFFIFFSFLVYFFFLLILSIIVAFSYVFVVRIFYFSICLFFPKMLFFFDTLYFVESRKKWLDFLY